MDLHARQYARVNVRTIQEEGKERPLNRSFSVDPRTITLDRLLHLLARALDIREEFSVLYQRSREGRSSPLSGDWDLEGALAEEACLDLKLLIEAKEPEFDEWDIICDADVPVAGHEAACYPPVKRKETLLEQVLSLYPLSSGSPLTESQFLELRDWAAPLRYATYRSGGAEPGIRPALWMHLLDVYPTGAGQTEREEFLNAKCEEYYGLRHGWQKLVQAGTIPDVLRDVTSLVRKDVRRTDRAQNLDEHALTNVLITFAVHHPSVGYCQGMGDLLSPLLRVQRTEARAYVALCGLMSRAKANFRRDGRSVSTKFRHLRRAIRAHDPQLYEHLSVAGALDLLFCYRWLLLDLKREFPYEDMLRLKELMWSALPPLPSELGVELFEVRFPTASVCEDIRERFLEPKDLMHFQEHHFGTPKGGRTLCQSLKRWAQLSRRISIARAMESNPSSDEEEEDDDDKSIIHYKRQRRSKDVCSSWSGRGSRGEECHPEGLSHANTVHDIQINHWVDSQSRKRHGSSDSNYGSTEEPPSEEEEEEVGNLSSQEEHSLSRNDSLDSYTSSDTVLADRDRLLPPPARLCDGKPFLLFLCLAMILEHRDAILDRRMDASEIGIYFDRLVRRHRLADVLPKAKDMFEKYLVSGWTEDD